jgi:type IV pilus assembly protein PilM
MKGGFSHFLQREFAPPAYLMLPTTGIDISSSAVKIVQFNETRHGLELGASAEERLPAGAIENGEIMDERPVVEALQSLKKKFSIERANITLPEARGYLFETEVIGKNKKEWRIETERKLDELVPLPVQDVLFDIAPLGMQGDMHHIIGVGYARSVVEKTLSLFEQVGITVRAVESETSALPRALLLHESTDTVLIIDIGKTTTKLLITSNRLPRLATTLDIGGHPLTLAVQKYFGVTEEDAKKIKAEQGLHVGEESKEFLQAMLSTLSVIRDEIVRRLQYWQARSEGASFHDPVSRVLLVGGNATLRGLPEYLQASLKIPVELGDVFCNLASKDEWLPEMDYTESLAYGTAIGLTLREHVT